MRSKWESLILGAFIACIALLVQVFIDVVCEAILHISYVTQYDRHMSIHVIFPSMIVAASIEEILRFSVIKKRMIQYTSNKTSSMIIHGSLFGFGFGLLELSLLYIRDHGALTLSPYLIYPFFIHIVFSIFYLFILKKYLKNTPILIILLIFSILMHALGNVALFMTL